MHKDDEEENYMNDQQLSHIPKNAVIIRFWEKDERRLPYGHISLEIPHKKIYTTYVMDDKNPGKGKFITTYTDDRSLMRKSENQSVTIYTLNTNAIFQRLSIFKSQCTEYSTFDTVRAIGDSTNNLLSGNSPTPLLWSSNCAHLVNDLLVAGGIEEIVPPIRPSRNLAITLLVVGLYSLLLTPSMPNEFLTNFFLFIFALCTLGIFITAAMMYIPCSYRTISLTGGVVKPETVFDKAQKAAKEEIKGRPKISFWGCTLWRSAPLPHSENRMEEGENSELLPEKVSLSYSS